MNLFQNVCFVCLDDKHVTKRFRLLDPIYYAFLNNIFKNVWATEKLYICESCFLYLQITCKFVHQCNVTKLKIENVQQIIESTQLDHENDDVRAIQSSELDNNGGIEASQCYQENQDIQPGIDNFSNNSNGEDNAFRPTTMPVTTSDLHNNEIDPNVKALLQETRGLSIEPREVANVTVIHAPKTNTGSSISTSPSILDPTTPGRHYLTVTSSTGPNEEMKSVLYTCIPHSCAQCNMGVNNTSTLHKNQIIKHRFCYACKECNKVYKTQYTLKRHMKVHSNEKSFNCMVCRAKFNSEQGLQAHIKVHVTVGPFICQHCDRSFRQSAHLHAHLSRCNSPAPYKCTFCSKVFVRDANLKRHMRICAQKHQV